MNEPYVHKISDAEQHKIDRFLRWAGIATAAFIILIVLLIVTAHRWLPLISVESERKFVAPYIDFMVKQAWVSENSDIQAALQQQLDKLTTAQPFNHQLTIHYVKSDEVNAFATLGGHIFVTDGLLRSLKTENSLMMVLAHEVGHIQERDPIIGLGRGVLIEMLFYSATGSSASGGLLSEISAQLALTRYSREQEKASDVFAIQTLHRVYGHVAGATTFFEQQLNKQQQVEGFAEQLLEAQPEWLMSHPETDERVTYLNEMIEQKGWQLGSQKPYPPALIKALSRFNK